MSRYKKPTFHSIFTVIILILLVESLFTIYKQNISEEINLNVQMSARNIQDNLVRKIAVLDTLETMTELTNYDESTFKDWAPMVYSIEDGISSVQLAPKGIVRYIYPLSGNEAAVGHNLLMDNTRKNGALRALRSKEIVFIGPVKLIQNDTRALISRKPIYRNIDGEDQFWGFATIILDINAMEFLDKSQEKTYDYRIIGYNPDSDVQPIIYDSGIEGGYDVEYPIYVPGGIWKLQFADKRRGRFIGMRILLYSLAALVGYLYISQHTKLIKKNESINELNKQLSYLTYKDELTSIYNRRGIYQLLDTKVQEHKLCSVAVIDVDNFKSINDQFGHDAGDNALKYISDQIQRSLIKQADVGRVGGDEFLCIFYREEIEIVRKCVKEMQDMLVEEPLLYDGHLISISISIGVAEYVRNEAIDKLIARADNEMYSNKKAKKQVI